MGENQNYLDGKKLVYVVSKYISTSSVVLSEIFVYLRIHYT